MATKLKNLKVKKVDFVNEGANPDAHICLTKKKDAVQSQGKNNEKERGVLHKLFSFIGKAAGLRQDEIDNAVEEIEKGESMTFGEKFNEKQKRKISDEVWDMCDALQSSIWSIVNDEELDSAGAGSAMKQSLDEFQSVMNDCIKRWSEGKIANISKREEDEMDIEFLKSKVSRLNELIEKNSVPQSQVEKLSNCNQTKGESSEMNIDKSKLTDSELLFLESIEKKYGVDEGQKELTYTPDVVISATTELVESGEGEDIYKGIHPVVKAQLESLEKFKAETELRELGQVAKKYEMIGKKPEELAPVLKSLRDAGGTAYNDMIAVLDQTLETVEKSGAFSEIGKSGYGSNENSAEAKIGVIAKGIMEQDPSIPYSKAVAKAWEEHPELLAEYDEQAGL